MHCNRALRSVPPQQLPRRRATSCSLPPPQKAARPGSARTRRLLFYYGTDKPHVEEGPQAKRQRVASDEASAAPSEALAPPQAGAGHIRKWETWKNIRQLSEACRAEALRLVAAQTWKKMRQFSQAAALASQSTEASRPRVTKRMRRLGWRTKSFSCQAGRAWVVSQVKSAKPIRSRELVSCLLQK